MFCRVLEFYGKDNSFAYVFQKIRQGLTAEQLSSLVRGTGPISSSYGYATAWTYKQKFKLYPVQAWHPQL